MKFQEVWKDRFGREITVADMSENYAKNVLCMLIRKINQINDPWNVMTNHMHDQDMHNAKGASQ